MTRLDRNSPSLSAVYCDLFESTRERDSSLESSPNFLWWSGECLRYSEDLAWSGLLLPALSMVSISLLTSVILIQFDDDSSAVSLQMSLSNVLFLFFSGHPLVS